LVIILLSSPAGAETPELAGLLERMPSLTREVIGKEFLQPLHLFLSSKLGKLSGHRSRTSSNQCEVVTSEGQEAACDIGRFAHLIDAPKQLPNRMTAQSVIALTPFELKS